MDMQQVVDGAQGQSAAPAQDGTGMSGMLDKMLAMRAMMDEMISAMQSDGKQAGFESVDDEG